MSQSAALIDTLKQALKSHQLTYASIARELSMSEANIKRLFASKRFTLERLEAICQLMQMDLADLVHLHEQSRQQITHFTKEQEQALVRDVKFLMVAIAVRNKFSFEEILAEFDISETECIHYLAKLDKLKIIDLLPNNRIKLLISDEFRWLTNGPIERFFETQIQSQFLKSKFNKEHEQRLFLFGMFSETSMHALNSKIQVLEKEFNEMHRLDAKLPVYKRKPLAFLLALRPWEADLFRPYLIKRKS